LTLPEEVRAVPAADVQRVARDYFRDDQRVVGWLEPTDAAESSEDTELGRAHTSRSAARRGSDAVSSSNESSQPFARAVTDGGVVILGQERPQSRSVSLRLRVPAGAMYEPSNKPGLAYLTAKSLLRGSAGQSFTQLNERTDRLGSSMTADAGREFVELRVRCLDDDVPEMIALLAQTLLSPDFDPGQIDLVRDEQLGAIAELDNDTRATADRIMRRAVYPEPNPMGRRVLGAAESLAHLGSADVGSYWVSVLGRGGLTFAVVGALGGFERVVELISRALQGWRASGRNHPSTDLSLVNREVVRVTAAIPGKSQSDLAMGIPTISRLNADYYALDIANHILGRQGLMGRLGAEVRDRQGLAYYASSQIEPRRDGSLWTARAGVDPDNVERALTSIEAELASIRTAEVTSEELENAKSQLIGVLPLALETNDGVANTLLAMEEFDLGLDYIDRYPALIREVNRERCLDAAARHLDPALLVVGVAEPASYPGQR
jgi:zinc protease